MKTNQRGRRVSSRPPPCLERTTGGCGVNAASALGNSKLGMSSSRWSSGPLYRKLRRSLVENAVSSRRLSRKSMTVGFLKVSCRHVHLDAAVEEGPELRASSSQARATFCSRSSSSNLRPSSDPAQTQLRPSSDPAQTQLRPSSDPAQTQLRPSSDSVQTQLRPSSDSAQTQLRPSSDSAQTQLRLCSDPAQTQLRLSSDSAQAELKLNSTPGPYSLVLLKESTREPPPSGWPQTSEDSRDVSSLKEAGPPDRTSGWRAFIRDVQ
ncbi:hypothetical protein CRUP_022597 [Coryphaenoides rupestris]|nr:hypothetical protein CRUP_022597 [Coryphaenoides rupestris]